MCVLSQKCMQSSAFLVASTVRYSKTIFNPHTLSVLAELSNMSDEVPAREVIDV